MQRLCSLLLLIPAFLYSQNTPEPENVHQELARAKREGFARFQALKKIVAPTMYGDYDVHFYQLDLTFDDLRKTVSGTVQLRATSTTTGQSSLELDLYNTGMTVDTVSGRASGWEHSNDHIRLEFSPALSAGEDFTVEITYHGSPAGAGFQGLSFSNHGSGDNTDPIISSLSEPYYARSWWPCKDVPSDKADSANINLTVANDLIPVSNGTLVDTVDNGDGTHTWLWQVRYPITTYLISVAISNYSHLTDTYTGLNGEIMPLDYYLYPEQAAQNSYRQSVNKTRQMIEVFASLYGEYPFIGEKYGMASFDWGGAMEHQTISSMGAYGTTINAHELAHQWWGDMVTCQNWHHIWLNEGFASYSEALYYEAIYGKPAYANHMNSMATGARRASGSVFVTDTTSLYTIFSSDRVYDKGAWVLHMLRHVVGDSTFFDILHEYRDEYYMSTATTEDFRDIAEMVSGMDLHSFFNEWVYGTGYPRYTYCIWTSSDGGQTEANVCVSQIQTADEGQLFTMPLDIKLSDNTGNDTTFVVQNNVTDTTYTFNLGWQPTNVVLDPDNWVLKTAQLTPSNLSQTGCELLTGFALAPNYPNPFNPGTNLTFTIPEGDHVSGYIYNLKGQRVVTVVDEYKLPAQYSYYWNGTNDRGEHVSSGVYFFMVRSGNQIKTQKLLLVR